MYLEINLYILLISFFLTLFFFQKKNLFYIFLIFIKNIYILFIFLCFFIFFALCVYDTSILHIFYYSHVHLPIIYKIGSFWSSHDGSIILWNIIIGFYCMLFYFFLIKKYDMVIIRNFSIINVPIILYIIFFFYFFFSSTMFIKFNSFIYNNEVFTLNPLLQDIILFIHPILLYFAYIGLFVPFVIVSLFTEFRYSLKYLISKVAYIHNVLLLVFTIGLVLGAWWAYYELGWGGWWFWDPVENIALLPWLLLIILIHVNRFNTPQRFDQFFLVLISFNFLFSIVSTCFIRAGLFTSVHTFIDNIIFNKFVNILFLFFFLSIIIILRKYYRKDKFRFHNPTLIETLFVGIYLLFFFSYFSFFNKIKILTKIRYFTYKIIYTILNFINVKILLGEIHYFKEPRNFKEAWGTLSALYYYDKIILIMCIFFLFILVGTFVPLPAIPLFPTNITPVFFDAVAKGCLPFLLIYFMIYLIKIKKEVFFFIDIWIVFIISLISPFVLPNMTPYLYSHPLLSLVGLLLYLQISIFIDTPKKFMLRAHILFLIFVTILLIEMAYGFHFLFITDLFTQFIFPRHDFWFQFISIIGFFEFDPAVIYLNFVMLHNKATYFNWLSPEVRLYGADLMVFKSVIKSNLLYDITLGLTEDQVGKYLKFRMVYTPFMSILWCVFIIFIGNIYLTLIKKKKKILWH